MEFSMMSPGVWKLFGWLENICAGHTPYNFHIWTPKDQGWSAVSWWEYGRAIDLSEGQGHIPYMVRHVLLEGQGWSPDHPLSRHCLFHSDLNSPWSNVKSTPALFRPALFQNFYQKVKRKCAGNQEKQWLHMAQIRKFYLIVKVGYYALFSLACASV